MTVRSDQIISRSPLARRDAFHDIHIKSVFREALIVRFHLDRYRVAQPVVSVHDGLFANGAKGGERDFRVSLLGCIHDPSEQSYIGRVEAIVAGIGEKQSSIKNV